MPINPNIALQVQPPQFQSPVNALAKVLQIQDMQQGQQMNALKMDEYQRGIREQQELRNSLAGPNADPYNSLLRLGRVKEANDFAKGQVETQKAQAENWAKTTGLFRDNIGNVNNPKQAAQFVQLMYLHPGMKGSPLTAQPVDVMLSNIPVDPEGLQRWKQDFALGATKFMELNKPNFTTRNTGGTTDTIATEGLTGRTSVVNSVKNTQSPGEAARLAQAERHFQAGQNAPQYMETDAGLVALPKKLAPGQVPTGTPVLTQDGRPLGKPLKDIPPSVNSAIIQNSQSFNQLDRALTLLSGKDVGQQKGDKEATGWKGYLPNTVLNRVDPQGVDARAEISDVGSLKIHDRSGAAVTISESPRLMPFIPLATDDHATVVKKLSRLKTELANESAALQATYSKEQGYKPSPVKPSGAAPAPDGVPADIAAILQKHGGK